MKVIKNILKTLLASHWDEAVDEEISKLKGETPEPYVSLRKVFSSAALSSNKGRVLDYLSQKIYDGEIKPQYFINSQDGRQRVSRFYDSILDIPESIDVESSGEKRDIDPFTDLDIVYCLPETDLNALD